MVKVLSRRGISNGGMFNVKLGTGYFNLPPLLCNLTSNKNNLSFISCQTNRLGFLTFLTYPCVSHTNSLIRFFSCCQPMSYRLCVVLPTLSIQTPLLFHLQMFEIVKSQLPEVLVPLTEYVCMTPEWKL